jgi:hypothetical protein
MDLAHAMHLAGVEEDPLRGGRLPGVDVSGDTDIPRLIQSK